MSFGKVQVPISGTGDTGPVPVAVDNCGGTVGNVGIGKLAISVEGNATLIPATLANGLLVDVSRSALPAGAATLAEQQTQSASLSVLDDWDESDRCKVNPIAGQAGVAGGSGVTGATVQRVVLATDVALPAGTNAIGKLAANSGVDIGDVDVTTVIPGTGGSNLGKAEDTAAVSGDTGVFVLGVRNDAAGPLTGTDGDYTAFATDIAGRVGICDLGGSITVDGAVTISGDVAHDAADSGNPVKAGGRALLTARTAVADGDRTDLATDGQGRVITERDGPRDLDVQASITITSSTAETDLLAAVASHFQDIIDCIAANKSATATLLTFKDSSGGTARFYLYVPAGATIGFSGQRWPQASVNNKWTVTCGTSVDSVYVSVRARKTK